MSREEVWDGIFRYILACNFYVTRVNENSQLKEKGFEQINADLLPLSDLSVEIDPILTFYKGIQLLNYFENNPAISEHLIATFKDINAYDVIPLVNSLLMIGSDGFYQYDYTNLNDIKQISSIKVV